MLDSKFKVSFKPILNYFLIIQLYLIKCLFFSFIPLFLCVGRIEKSIMDIGICNIQFHPIRRTNILLFASVFRIFHPSAWSVSNRSTFHTAIYDYVRLMIVRITNRNSNSKNFMIFLWCIELITVCFCYNYELRQIKKSQKNFFDCFFFLEIDFVAKTEKSDS